MKYVVLGILMELVALHIFADGACSKTLSKYKVVPNSTYPFDIKGKKACFFAFYTKNLDPSTDVKGNGNLDDSIWYGYYKENNPSRIYKFPKPSNIFWSNVCSIEAISFYPMHGGKKRDVTVIGSCNKYNAMHYTFPFVFVWKNGQFVLDEEVYSNLFGIISLTVSDIQKYIKSPKTCLKILQNRYNWRENSKMNCD